MPAAILTQRGILSVGGPDALTFLNGLVTCDLEKVGPLRACFGALLSPQGKILFDFFAFVRDDEGGKTYLLDVSLKSASDLARRLAFYKLRAKVEILDRSEQWAVVAGWGETPLPAPDTTIAVAEDPRLPELGWRAIVDRQKLATHPFSVTEETAFRAHRLSLGVPEGAEDFDFGDAFPHEALMDQLHGVGFDKGCYVGQEVVSRMEHRGTARTRLVPITSSVDISLEKGTEIKAGDRTVGHVATGANGQGLAMIRLDRVADAFEAGHALLANGIPIGLKKPSWIRFSFPHESAKPAS